MSLRARHSRREIIHDPKADSPYLHGAVNFGRERGRLRLVLIYALCSEALKDLGIADFTSQVSSGATERSWRAQPPSASACDTSLLCPSALLTTKPSILPIRSSIEYGFDITSFMPADRISSF